MPFRAGHWILLRVVVAFISLSVASAGSVYSLADDPRAAVIVQFDDGSHIVSVVDLASPALSGLELLRSSGLDVRSDSGMICSIGPTGCGPTEQCMCQMPNFWGYWQLVGTEWKWSGVGAGQRVVAPGDVDGWTWGGHVNPPLIDVAEVFDMNRIAPGVPIVTAAQGQIDVLVEAEGDANGNAQVNARYRKAATGGPDVTVEMARDGNTFAGTLAQGLSDGRYALAIEYMDPDGVNGSATWNRFATIDDATEIYLPALFLLGTTAVGR